MGLLRVLGSPALASSSSSFPSGKLSSKRGGKTFTPEAEKQSPCSVPSCCPARAQWQVSPLSCPCPVAAVPLGGHGAPERAQLSLHSAGSVQGVTAQLLLAYAGLELCPLSPETQCPSLEVTWELPALRSGGGREGTLREALCTPQSTNGLGLRGSVSS